MSRTAIDEIIDLNLNENICQIRADKIKKFIEDNWYMEFDEYYNKRKDIPQEVRLREMKKMKMRLYYALELVREEISDELDEISIEMQVNKDMKPFKDVKIGDSAIDYNEDTFIVYDMGPADEMYKKYGNESPIGIK